MDHTNLFSLGKLIKYRYHFVRRSNTAIFKIIKAQTAATLLLMWTQLSVSFLKQNKKKELGFDGKYHSVWGQKEFSFCKE